MSGTVTAQSDFLTALAFTLPEEGPYGNDPNDPGGPTNLGATISSWSEYIGRQATVDEIKALTVDLVMPFYHTRYWNALLCWGLPKGAGLMSFDHAVNGGAYGCIKVVQAVVAAGQSIVAVKQDGIMGPVTASAARAMPATTLITSLHDAMVRDYQNKGNFARYGQEWLGRLDRCRTESLRIAATN